MFKVKNGFANTGDLVEVISAVEAKVFLAILIGETQNHVMHGDTLYDVYDIEKQTYRSHFHVTRVSIIK